MTPSDTHPRTATDSSDHTPGSTNPPQISVVVPVFNEGAAAVPNLEQILQLLRALETPFELIVVDDGSRDHSLAAIQELAADQPALRVLAFTRNFGKEAAIHAGLAHARGQCAVVMDSDLQHPPELIAPMLQAWREGYLVVEGVKRQRSDPSPIGRIMATTFYRLYRTLSGFDIEGHSDFKLLDRQVVAAYLDMPERYRFFRGLVNWLGIENHQIIFDVPPRASGQGRWPKLGLIAYAINNITAFSTVPLTIVTLLGIVTVGLGGILGAIALYQKLAGTAAAGFTTLNMLLLLMGGAIMISLGIIGHYVGRIYTEIKARPHYVLKPFKHD